LIEAVAGMLAGVSSAFLAMALNTQLAKYSKMRAVIFAGPVVEEVLKTSAAAVLGGNLILSHFIFGTVEAVYDVRKKGDRRAAIAGILAVLSQTLFGSVTVLAWGYFKSLPAGIFVACALHAGWNHWVMKLSCQKE